MLFYTSSIISMFYFLCAIVEKCIQHILDNAMDSRMYPLLTGANTYFKALLSHV